MQEDVRPRQARNSRTEGSVEAAVELAGYFMAHAVWCIAEGETLVPILAFEWQLGGREFHRLEGRELQIEVARGREWLATNPASVQIAALIYDAFVTLDAGRNDALLAEVRCFEPEPASLTIVVPYRHAGTTQRFAVYRPKFLHGVEGTRHDSAKLGEAFFRGVDRHEQGSAVWDAALDGSR